MGDAAVVVAAIGVVTTMVTTLGGVAVAVVNSRREDRNADSVSLADGLRERIVFRDEQIEMLRRQLGECRAELKGSRS